MKKQKPFIIYVDLNMEGEIYTYPVKVQKHGVALKFSNRWNMLQDLYLSRENRKEIIRAVLFACNSGNILKEGA